MRSLKALSRAHGGQYAVQSVLRPGESRDYWLIMESFHALSSGWISRAAQIHRSWAMRRHKEEGRTRVLQVYSLVFLTQGEGTFWDGRTRREQAVRAGDLLCLFPGIGHVYASTPGTYWNEINVEFSGPAFDAWTGAGLLDPNEPVRRLAPSGSPADVSRWLRRFHEVVLPIARRGGEPLLADTARMITLIVEMCALWQTPRMDADVEWANEARARLLAMPPDEPLDLVKEARVFGLGEQAYRKKFKRLCGLTPSLFRSRHLVERACRALIASNAPIKRIAYESGFGSKFYFSRRFKQITGMSPGEYRRRAGE